MPSLTHSNHRVSSSPSATAQQARQTDHMSTKDKESPEIGTSTRLLQSSDAFTLQEAGDFAFEKRWISTSCSSRDVLVRIMATGLCGSDLHFWKHGQIGNCVVTSPIVLGHESAGVVESCSPDVEGIAVGDRVALEPGISCNTCDTCRSGKYNLCESMRFAANPPFDGTLSTFYRVTEECCFKLPPQVSFEEGALVEPLSVAVHCCRLAGIAPCSSLAVFGAGPIGLLCSAITQAFGASAIVVVDIVKSRLDFAKNYIQVETHHIGDEGLKKSELLLSKLGTPAGTDIVIDATGVESCIDHGIKILKRGGAFIQAGLGPARIDFPIAEICNKEVTFKGSYRYGPGDYKLAIELLKTEKIRVKDLITNRYGFWEAEQAFIDSSKKQGIKSIVHGPSISPRAETSIRHKI